ncbi:MAG: tRNA (adenosine(37)-N6)-threonylcarbamoyltransferase complex ATPase subunit type 1 TsaE [Bacteroidota bacterium]|jgi:tRNA threonylcarbamoyladenosine biosynthesis protein TsaE
MERFVTHNEEETIAAGVALAQMLNAGSVVALFGDLGSGKTRFAKGISRGLGVKEIVASPTFTIVNEHRDGRLPLFHFDFYRIRSIAELEDIGFEEYIFGDGVCVLEWADMILPRLPEHRIDVQCLLGETETDRIITIEQR